RTPGDAAARGRGARTRSVPHRVERLRRERGRARPLPFARLRRDGSLDVQERLSGTADERSAGNLPVPQLLVQAPDGLVPDLVRRLQPLVALLLRPGDLSVLER